jgi:hypothetical protein
LDRDARLFSRVFFPLAVFGIVWEFPTMKADNAVTKLDSRLRGIFPSDFAPGDVLEREIPEPGTVLFRLLKPAEAPLECPRFSYQEL